MKKKKIKSKQKGKRYCFAGKHHVWGDKIVRLGKHQDGSWWFLCEECHDAYKDNKEQVKISYLPGFEPPERPKPEPDAPPERLTRTKFPFKATINGDEAIVWPDWIEYPEEDPLNA